jgi:hypothetical protein
MVSWNYKEVLERSVPDHLFLPTAVFHPDSNILVWLYIKIPVNRMTEVKSANESHRFSFVRPPSNQLPQSAFPTPTNCHRL